MNTRVVGVNRLELSGSSARSGRDPQLPCITSSHAINFRSSPISLLACSRFQARLECGASWPWGRWCSCGLVETCLTEDDLLFPVLVAHEYPTARDQRLRRGPAEVVETLSSNTSRSAGPEEIARHRRISRAPRDGVRGSRPSAEESCSLSPRADLEDRCPPPRANARDCKQAEGLWVCGSVGLWCAGGPTDRPTYRPTDLISSHTSSSTGTPACGCPRGFAGRIRR